MSLQQLLLILRARAWVIAALLALGVAGALAANQLLPRMYTATTTVVVDSKIQDTVTGALIPAPLMSTQLEIIRSQRVALQVVAATRIVESAVARQAFEDKTGGRGSIAHWWADRMLANLEAQGRRDSNLVDIRFSAQEPRFAAAVANSFAKAYMETTVELTLEPSRQTASFFDEQMKGLRGAVEKAQARLGKTQQKYGIVATDERLDVEQARFGELSSELTTVQGEARDHLIRQRKAAEFLARNGAPEDVPDVLSNALVQSLKAELLRAEAKLQESSALIGINHPQYQRQFSEITALRQKLDQEIRSVTSGMATLSELSLERQARLARAVEEQKDKLLQFKRQHDEISVLRAESETAQKTYDAAMQRYTQTNLASRGGQTNVALLNPAVEPIEPSSPRVFRNLLVGIIAGFVLGLNLAIALEMLDRRVRTPEDVTAETALPVLGVLGGRERKGRWHHPVLARTAALLRLRKDRGAARSAG